MELDAQSLLFALLIALPAAFAIGWVASRMDLRQWKRTDREAPKAYFKGLNLLLNEQPDKAIDAFIEAVQHDPDTSELHFALGNLFRRRGEFERAVRVHEHLLQRADLSQGDRERAQYALAHDFMKAGLFDRAEAAFAALEGTPFETEARLARLSLHERSRDWAGAAEVAGRLEKTGAGSFATRIAHYLCEQATEADARGDGSSAETLLLQAQAAAPQSARPWVQRAERLARAGHADAALAVYQTLAQRNPDAFARVAGDAVACAQAAGQLPALRDTLNRLFEQQPGIDLLRALARADGHAPGASPRLPALLREQPSLTAAIDLLDQAAALWPEQAQATVREAVARAARPLQRYRCAACGFESQRHFWQCPGCLGWDTFPPQRIEEL
ncbi:lipopolysaccharide assembly protein LapB [Aquabacterium sp. OR-4]|uniref:lipopolysaccharide assembly protein LapB n=1 Tax=Aquabacterium sp. OR-4 TaxID=2978127 RepID=UPI0021B2F48B|nr:lipopolysaccharide assembly protein LapB [Aquabacterium sp. OR-4]MDT7836838.1 lipopolysaccharide assembly protein LapB [Aquabacterium sp. OR-4]